MVDKKPQSSSEFPPAVHGLLEEIIARYRSPEQRRLALRRALKASPTENRLRHALSTLTGPQFVRQAVRGRVFISYTRLDEVFAVELAVRLKAVGVGVWLDMFDISDSGDWRGQVTTALNTCGLMVAILSPRALYDPEARAEREYFHDLGKLVQPVIYRPCRPDLTDYWLKPVDLAGDPAADFDKLLTALTITPARA